MQPMFMTLEAALIAAVPALDEWAGAGGRVGRVRESVLRYAVRWSYVISTTVFAFGIPMFGPILGLMGAQQRGICVDCR